MARTKEALRHWTFLGCGSEELAQERRTDTPTYNSDVMTAQRLPLTKTAVPNPSHPDRSLFCLPIPLGSFRLKSLCREEHNLRPRLPSTTYFFFLLQNRYFVSDKPAPVMYKLYLISFESQILFFLF